MAKPKSLQERMAKASEVYFGAMAELCQEGGVLEFDFVKSVVTVRAPGKGAGQYLVQIQHIGGEMFRLNEQEPAP